jgi:hypothetical protein
VITRHDERWVPDRVSLEEVDSCWATLCSRNARYFDGSILHVLGVVRNGHGGVTIHTAESSYRFYAVQQAGLDTGARPLGVKGLCRSDDGWLMGRRSESVAYYPGEWEFVPGGSVPADGNPAEVLLAELGEESGWCATGPARAVSVLYDPGAFSWEIVSMLDVRKGADAPGQPWEYDEIAIVPAGEEPQPLSSVARMMMQIRDGLNDVG